ncbi:MAG: cadmium-translocating P-type ATPase [Clostridia bacterium]|nr:cadmium-translocating P-type ATPase [Clostridia bacterium]MBR4577703.1 cadmium-translocating P-type ATPase [Clostridia bacterium]
MTRKQRKTLIRILLSALLLGGLLLIPEDSLGRVPMFLLYLVPYGIIGYDILKKAFRGILNRQVFDENFLMAVATLGALAIGLLKTGDFVEAVAVMWFYQIGELFQSYAVGKSRKNISALMDIRPDTARLLTADGPEETDPEQVPVGSIILVNPGEKVPIDGIVEEGESSLNTSALTGESIPRDVKPGDEIISGCVNMSGVLRIRTTKEFGESTVSKILELVENASSLKSRSENFISRFARYYTPAVVIGALALAVLPPAVRGLFLGVAPEWGEWIYRALTFLVISCPCALVISIPLSFFAGIGGAGKAGILVKGSVWLEKLAQAGTVVFDKTGTLTQGRFEVTAVHHSPLTDEELLEYAALAESSSSHPIAVSIRNACSRKPDLSRVSRVEEISGNGVCVMVDGKQVACGNARLMEHLGISFTDCHETGTIVHMAIDGAYAGHIVISDREKPESREAIAELKATGIRRTVMLTGDRDAVARQVADRLGLDQVYSDLLPEDKVSLLEELLKSRNPKEVLVFVGDGINDAPVLTRADLGIAMGAMGSDAAIEAADIVLMDDNPLKIPKAIRIARKCMRIVRQNIVFALAVKAVCLILGALGIANMWIAVFADVGVMILAVLNAIRALFIRRL